MDNQLKHIMIMFLLMFLFPLSCVWLICGDRSDEYLDSKSNNEIAIYDDEFVTVEIKYGYYLNVYAPLPSEDQEDRKYNSSIIITNKSKYFRIYIDNVDVKYLSNDIEINNDKYFVFNSNASAIPFNNFNDLNMKYRVLPGIVEAENISGINVSKHGYNYSQSECRFSFVFKEYMRFHKNIIMNINIVLNVDNKQIKIDKRIPLKLSMGYKLYCDD